MKNYITPSKSDKFLNKINHFLHESNQWFFNTSERALEQAYQIALKIKNIELEHFGGDKVSTQGESTAKMSWTVFKQTLKNI